ncbi:MAG: hypothetical protein JW864_05905 [Spirochaetes bacterium]|nr:hypothetical protein [Spirochaetota bacterium]
MNNSICGDCINREICGVKQKTNCEHYDVALTRSEVLNILGELQTKNPNVVPSILGAVKKTYRINMAF